MYFVCRGYQHNTSLCTAHNIKEKTVTDSVISDIKCRIAEECSFDSLYKIAEKRIEQAVNKTEIMKQLDFTQRAAECLKRDIYALYEDKLREIITSGEYRIISERKRTELAECIKKAEELKILSEKYSCNKKMLAAEVTQKFFDSACFTQAMMKCLINRVELSEKNELMIFYK